MSISSSFSSRLRMLACAGLASLLLASCGGGGSGGTSDSIALNASAPAATNAEAATAPATPSDATVPATVASPSVSTPVTPATPAATTPAAGGGNTNPTPTPPQVVPRVVEYYGDSTIWGYGSGTGVRVAVPAPAAFASALPAAAKITVRNEGVNGTTSCDLLNGADGRHPAWDAQMTASDAAVVIINHAINDQWRMDLATYKSCLTALARTAKSHGKKVVFETPNPTRDSGAGGLDVYVNAMKSVAVQEQLPVIDQYRYLSDYLNGKSPYTICPDGLHPSDAVYIMKGKYAAGVFQDLAL